MLQRFVHTLRARRDPGDRRLRLRLRLRQVLRMGARVFVRDYGLYDHAQLRFSRGHKLAEAFYVRQDGTRAYYFDRGTLHRHVVQIAAHGGSVSNAPCDRGRSPRGAVLPRRLHGGIVHVQSQRNAKSQGGSLRTARVCPGHLYPVEPVIGRGTGALGEPATRAVPA